MARTTVAKFDTEGGQDSLNRDDYFPTMVFSSMLHDAESLNKDIMKAINDERDRDEKGIERSNIKALGGWHSHNNLHKDKAFDRLTNRIHTLLKGIPKNLGYATNRHLELTTMWSVSNPPLASNRTHIHPGALWSGVYYVQTPEGAGKLDMTDPRTVATMHQPIYTKHHKRKVETWNKVTIKPVAGKLLFFPAWLYHGIAPNMAEGSGRDADRVVIAFNVNQKVTPTKK